MTRVLVATADQSISFDLRNSLAEMPGIDAGYVVESTTELVAAVLQVDPDIVLVHDRLGPDMPLQVVRDLGLRRPACAILIVTGSGTADSLGAAMEAGARGVVAHPIGFEDLQARIANAADWAAQMRQLLGAATAASVAEATGRGRVVAFVGAKGGVGTTTVATHLALDVVRSVPGLRVCLLDLDLEKGDVPAFIVARHRASVADVAKVADDLSSRAVADAVVAHESGLHLLLAPLDLTDVESVTPRALREIFGVLRQDYDLVIVDGGSHVTPAQATVVEIADELVAVTTPDVAAMRGLRRAIGMWEGLAVRKETDVRVLVNRLAKATTVSGDAVRQLTRAPVLDVGLPAMFRRLEPALNQRDPFAVKEAAWWRAMRAIGQEVGVVPAAPSPLAGERQRAGTHPRRRSGRRGGSDDGSVSLETVAVFPMLLVALLLVGQIAAYGLAMVWSGHAASAAARAASVGTDVSAAARDAVPDGVAADLSVSSPSRESVSVSVAVPLLVGGLGVLPTRITTTRDVVVEP